MQIQELFVRPIDRLIHKVVDVGNYQNTVLHTEIDEYVITNEISGHLGKLLDVYLSRQRVNSIGVWIAGYFGSGKSHLLKMLSFLLANKTFAHVSGEEAQQTVTIFAQKVLGDSILRGQISRIADIPSESILFNIDQQAPQGTNRGSDVVLAVFLKMFNNHCGYFGNTPFIADFERDLDQHGHFAQFKTRFAQLSGQSWEQGREAYVFFQDQIDQTFADVTGTSGANAQGIIQRYENNFSMSISHFGDLVKAYVERQGSTFRLNFFVDEVGQFVANQTQLMLNLQSISEVFSEKIPGRAWIFITSQQDLSSLINNFKGQDLSKIQARFGNSINLTSSSVDEVIQKRLLTKRDGVVPTLQALHQREYNNYATLFTFSDSSELFNRSYGDEKQFVDFYPFVPYQFILFQQAIVSLSNQEAFVGSYQAVGERSLIAAAQEAVIQKMHQETGKLIAFDDMYRAIDNSLRTIFKNGIILAAQTNIPPMAQRILKVLFLVKYVKNFSATAHNLRVLLFDTFQSDMKTFDNSINEALNYLEQRAFVQRDGKTFSYLTDEEKEIEKSIRGLAVDTSAITSEIDKLVFQRALSISTGKMKIGIYDQDFPFVRFVDHSMIGQSQEISVRIITPYHDTQDINVLAVQTSGKAELIIKLADSGNFIDELRLYIQTQRYIAQANTQNASDTTSGLLQSRAKQNQRRYDQINQDIKTALVEATYICNAGILHIGGGDHAGKFANAFTQMIQIIYPNRQMVQSQYDKKKVNDIATNTSAMLDGQETIAKEVMNHINMMHASHQKVDFKSILDKFQRRPYGWPFYAILAAVAMLHHADDIEVRHNGNIITKKDLTSVLDNAAAASTILIEAQSIPAALIQPLIHFYTDYFANAMMSAPPGQVVETIKQAFMAELKELKQIRMDGQRYPFVTQLDHHIHQLEQILVQSTNWFFNDFTTAQRSAWVEAKNDLINPMLHFFKSQNKGKFDDALMLVNDNDGNVSIAAPAEQNSLRQLINHPAAFRGAQMVQLTQATQRIRDLVTQKTQQMQQQVIAEISQIEQQQVMQMDDFARLDTAQRALVAQQFRTIYDSITHERRLIILQQTAAKFRSTDLPQIMNAIHQAAQPPLPVPAGTVAPIASPKVVYISAREIDFDTKKVIENQADLEYHLNAIRQAYQKALAEGKKITLS